MQNSPLYSMGDLATGKGHKSHVMHIYCMEVNMYIPQTKKYEYIKNNRIHGPGRDEADDNSLRYGGSHTLASAVALKSC